MAQPAITDRIGSAVLECLRAAALAPTPATLTVRKRPMKADGDKLPLLLVCVGDDEEFEPLGSSGTRGTLTWLVRRPVALAMAFATAGNLSNDPALRAWRDAIWSTCSQLSLARAGLTEANNVMPAGRPIFDAAAFRDNTVDWSVVTFTVETLENRSI